MASKDRVQPSMAVDPHAALAMASLTKDGTQGTLIKDERNCSRIREISSRSL